MKHQKIFDQIETFFVQVFNQRISKSDFNGNACLRIFESDFYVLCNVEELTVYYGDIHQHFNDDYLQEAIDTIFSLITNRIKVQNFTRGNNLYKQIVEIEFPDGHYEYFGSKFNIFNRFWKKTKTEIIYFEKLIDADKTIKAFEEFKKSIHNPDA